MRCEEFEIRLQQQLDVRADISQDPLLRSHASLCLDCERIFELQQYLALETASLDCEPSPGFSERVVGEFTQTRSFQRRLGWSALGFVGLVAATLLIAFVAQGNRDPSPQPVPSPPLAAKPKPAQNNVTSVASGNIGLGWINNIQPSEINVPVTTAPLRPIATGFQTTFEALRRTIPGGRTPEEALEPQCSRLLIPAFVA